MLKTLGLWLFALILSIPIATSALASIVATAVTPYIKTSLGNTSAAVNMDVVFAVITHAATLLKGSTPSYVAIDVYSATEVASMSTNFVTLARSVLSSFDIPVASADVDRLLGEVASRIVANVSLA